jgi:ABC-2 type transport system ATP-binding protein
MVKELSSGELEAACRKCMRLKVTKLGVLTHVLDTMDLEYNIFSDSETDIYGEVNITELVLALAKEHCEILSLHDHDESLESYYIGLSGGGAHE